jgi:hypothetical protein
LAAATAAQDEVDRVNRANVEKAIKDSSEKERIRILNRQVEMNKLLDMLNQQKQVRAREVLNMIALRGETKIGKQKISYLEKQEELDYDTIMNGW